MRACICLFQIIFVAFVHVFQPLCAFVCQTRSSRWISYRQFSNTAVFSRANNDVRLLMEVIRDRVGGPEDSLNQPLSSNWTRTRNYLYRSADRLSAEQVNRVINFLKEIFPGDQSLQKMVLQQRPRILRKNCDTKLRPTVELLKSLYGSEMMKEAVRRNPDLLFTRGTGFNLDSSSFDLNEIMFREELGLTHSEVHSLLERLPEIFQVSTSKLLSTIHFFRHHLLEAVGDEKKATKATARLLTKQPHVFLFSVEEALKPRVEFLTSSLCWNKTDFGRMLQSPSAGAVLYLSVKDNLEPKIRLLSERLETPVLGKTVKSHPQLLGLSITNLNDKLSYFDGIDAACSIPETLIQSKNLKSSLVSRILQRSPEVFSLSLVDNIIPKVDFLAGIWGVASPNSRFDENHLNRNHQQFSLAQQLQQYPSVLTLSLEGNLQPTVEFYNRTGYVCLDDQWKRRTTDCDDVSRILTPRELTASLWRRLLPRWHFASLSGVRSPPLYLLAMATDHAFCAAMELDEEEYRNFRREEIPRLKFSSQFNTWLKTGRPIDI